MGGKNYIQKGCDADRREAAAVMEARRWSLTRQMDRLGLSDEERRDLARLALELDTPLSVLVSELERMMKEAQ